MNEFLGNITDTTISKNPKGTWQRAKNILLTKGFNSISNEDGFLKKEDFSGVVIGKIITNIDEVYFIVDGAISEIGYINKRIQNPTYEVILRDSNLGFRLDCPIEGIYNYNYKGELIVCWCHGIRNNSARPMILNINNPAFSITNGVIDNANELELIYLFPNLNEGDYNITRLEEGNLTGDVAYVTYAYVYEDGSRTQFFPVSNISYITEGYLNTKRFGLNIEITDLDTKFSKLKLGVVLRDETTIGGYISYEIPFTTTNTLVYDFTSIDSWTKTSADEILIRSDSFTKIKTMTTTYDQVHIGNTIKASPLEFQKYANMLTLEPVLEVSDENNQHSFMPDEVYAMFIELQLLDGSYSDAFHIPGRVSSGTETDVLTAQQITDFNLSWLDANTKQFKIFNTGTVGGTVGNFTTTFGYWENEEVYPNNDNYNSSGVGGSDLRGTPIRHHRFAGIKALYNLDPTYLPNRDGRDDIDELLDEILKGNQPRYIFSTKCINFDSVVPQSIKDQIQGYRILYAKRNFANSLVIDNCAVIKRKIVNGLLQTYEDTRNSVQFRGLTDYNFQYSRLFSAPLFNRKPAIQPSHVIFNYIYKLSRRPSGNFDDVVPDANTYSEVSSISYAPGNNLAYGNQYTEEGIDMDLESFNDLDIPNTTDSEPNFLGANASLIQIKDNLYSGLSTTELIVAGRVDDITSSKILRDGDVSVKTFIDCDVYENYFLGDWINFSERLTFIGYYNPLHTMALYNNYDRADYGIVGNAAILEARDYTFQIKENLGASSLNDLNSSRSFNIESEFVNRFPYRINSTNKIPSEGTITEVLRTFPVDSYYDMPNHKGEIWALRGSIKSLYIQQKFSLFLTKVKDRLYTSGENVFLGTSNLFDTIPDEIVRDDKGYIGCTSQFACILFKGGYVTVDQVQGKIFIIYDGKSEISAKGKRNYFKDNWDIGFDISDDENGFEERVDNPFVSVGHTVGYDDRNNRLLFTKKHFVPKSVQGVTREGQFYILDATGDYIDYTNKTYFIDKSTTWSYSLDNNAWVCEHDYKPNMIFDTGGNLYSIINSFTGGKLYKHNILTTKGNFYGTIYPSYVDLIFNGNLDISKLYESIMWISDTINSNNGDVYNKTITHIAVYNKSQGTGLINLKDNEFLLTRTNEGHWNFNAFRDLVIDQFSPVIGEDGEFVDSNINSDKLWFEKNNFISKFIVVRLYIDNLSQDTVYIHSVNVKSIKSIR